ncbi:MAG TPA: hypothetical protein VFE33_01240 [Thermoanaerobaculia bacterium]|nr:hypothetical protein [Thermoanaerobaculia bacterium]
MTKTDEEERSCWTVWSPGVIFLKREEDGALPPHEGQVRVRLRVPGEDRVEFILTADGKVYIRVVEGEQP